MYSRSSDKTLAPFVFGVYPKPIRGHYLREEKMMGNPKKGGLRHEQRIIKEDVNQAKHG